MRFREAERRERGEAIVPMINVVFLLLIFFLMTATIAPHAPFEVVPPASDADEAEVREVTVFLSAEGAVAASGVEGTDPDAWAASGAFEGATVLLRADASAKASDLVRLVTRIEMAGAEAVSVATAPR